MLVYILSIPQVYPCTDFMVNWKTLDNWWSHEHIDCKSALTQHHGNESNRSRSQASLIISYLFLALASDSSWSFYPCFVDHLPYWWSRFSPKPPSSRPPIRGNPNYSSHRNNHEKYPRTPDQQNPRSAPLNLGSFKPIEIEPGLRYTLPCAVRLQIPHHSAILENSYPIIKMPNCS